MSWQPMGRDIQAYTMPQFRYLKDDVVVRKIAQLQARIEERFPERNLVRVCETRHEIAVDAQTRLA